MSNYAWVLEVRPGYEEEYKKRHDELWPEMKDMLRDAGIRNYNIFRIAAGIGAPVFSPSL